MAQQSATYGGGRSTLSTRRGFALETAHGRPALLMLDKTGLLCWNEIGRSPGLAEYAPVPFWPAFHYAYGTVAHRHALLCCCEGASIRALILRHL
jgi:hypothetical protein